MSVALDFLEAAAIAAGPCALTLGAAAAVCRCGGSRSGRSARGGRGGWGRTAARARQQLDSTAAAATAACATAAGAASVSRCGGGRGGDDDVVVVVVVVVRYRMDRHGRSSAAAQPGRRGSQYRLWGR